MSSPERSAAARLTCTPFLVASPRRSTSAPSGEPLVSTLTVPELLDLRVTTLDALSRLDEQPPADLPFAMRMRTCAAKREAVSALTLRLAEAELELERRGALPPPDELAVRALPAWLGAWPAPARLVATTSPATPAGSLA
jgi:hypothetical protein